MLSYCIFEKNYWGKGIATKAVDLFLQEVKAKYSINTVGAFCYSENMASVRVLVRNEFTCCETFIEDGTQSSYFEKRAYNL